MIEAEDMVDDLAVMIEDPAVFFALLSITDKETFAVICLLLKPAQFALLRILLTEKKVIVVKSRQLGITTLLRAYSLYCMYFLDSGQSFESIAMALTDGTTKVLSRMDQEMYESLPGFMRDIRPIAQSNVELLRFSKPSAISHYLSAKADNTVRGKSINFAHLTEFAFYPDQEKKLREVSNALSVTGQLVIETTPNRPGDRYHQMAQRAKDGVDSEYTLFFWPWYKHDLNRRDVGADFVRTPDEKALELKYSVSEGNPNLKLTDEQLQWRRYQINEYGEALFKKENPGTFEEAFEHLSGQWFSQNAIETIEVTWKAEGYRADDCYAAGLDIGGGGGANADWSVLAITSKATKQLVYFFATNSLAPKLFAQRCIPLIDTYKCDKILVESNNHGHVVLNEFRQNSGLAHRLWQSPAGKDWTTSLQSKLDMYNLLRDRVEADTYESLPSVFKNELGQMTVPPGKLAPSHPDGGHDDHADALALSNMALDAIRKTPSRAWTPADRQAAMMRKMLGGTSVQSLPSRNQ